MFAVAAVALAIVAASDADKPAEPPSKAELAAISQRGRDLAGYDAAAWHASDAVQTRNPRPGSVVRYIARKTEPGWTVAFGRLDDARDQFLIAYQATRGKEADEFAVRAFDPPKADTGFFRAAARAIDTTLKDFTAHFEGEPRPYNVAVLPADKDRFWVYLVPAPTRPGIWPLGGDVRYRISPAGTTIEAKRTLHRSVIEIAPPPRKDDQKPVAGMHTHVVAETPEDTDVFHVLTRKPSVPELIRTEHFIFVVEADGEAKYAGKAGDAAGKP